MEYCSTWKGLLSAGKKGVAKMEVAGLGLSFFSLLFIVTLVMLNKFENHSHWKMEDWLAFGAFVSFIIGQGMVLVSDIIGR